MKCLLPSRFVEGLYYHVHWQKIEFTSYWNRSIVGWTAILSGIIEDKEELASTRIRWNHMRPDSSRSITVYYVSDKNGRFLSTGVAIANTFSKLPIKEVRPVKAIKVGPVTLHLNVPDSEFSKGIYENTPVYVSER